MSTLSRKKQTQKRHRRLRRFLNGTKDRPRLCVFRSNNHIYAESVSSKKLDRESEILNTKDMYNEYIMTGLRKIDGLSLGHIKKVFGNTYSAYFEEQVGRHLEQRNIFWDGDYLKVSRQAKFLTDGIASDLFII